MRWAKEHPEIMRATSEFVRVFQNVPDPIVEVANRAKTLEAKIAWVIFGSCLSQEISLGLLSRVLQTLFSKFPDDASWKFPLATEDEIRKTVREAKGSLNWPLEESVPGIFWSVGNFVRRRSPLAGWASSTEFKGLLRDLGEVFFMGKGAYRPKAIFALSRIFSEAPRGLGLVRSHFEGEIVPVPFAFGTRRWIGFIGPGKDLNYAEMDEVKKRKLGFSVAKAISPQDPRIASHSLQFFLESETSENYLCSEKTENCKLCPLANFCSKSLVKNA